jgi:hypothetical protein
MSSETNGPSKNDRYQEKQKFYEGLNVLPKKVSQANSALILVNALSVGGLCTLAKFNAPWFTYLILAFFATKDSALAVWREKNAKRINSRSNSRKDSS